MRDARWTTEPGRRIVGPVTFDNPTVRSRKVQCQTCGSTGLGMTGTFTPADIAPDAPPKFGVQVLMPWQRSCIAGHEGCRGCGRIIRLTKKGNGRRAHTRGQRPGSCTAAAS